MVNPFSKRSARQSLYFVLGLKVVSAGTCLNATKLTRRFQEEVRQVSQALEVALTVPSSIDGF